MTADRWCRRADIVAGVHPEEFQFGENSVAASVTTLVIVVVVVGD
jgi:hypothetical protein